MESTNEVKKIQRFTDLHAWKAAHALVLSIYRATDVFPAKEQFGLTSQMRRAAVSISSNIAEGFTRRSAKEKYQFYTTAQASLTELQNQLLVARDVGYLPKDIFQHIAAKSVEVSKLLSGLLRATKEKRFER